MVALALFSVFKRPCISRNHFVIPQSDPEIFLPTPVCRELSASAQQQMLPLLWMSADYVLHRTEHKNLCMVPLHQMSTRFLSSTSRIKYFTFCCQSGNKSYPRDCYISRLGLVHHFLFRSISADCSWLLFCFSRAICLIRNLSRTDSRPLIMRGLGRLLAQPSIIL